MLTSVTTKRRWIWLLRLSQWACHLWICLLSGSNILVFFLFILSIPMTVRHGDSISYQLIVICFCLLLASPTAVYSASFSRLPWMIFCLPRLPLLSSPLSHQSCQIKITSLKIQSTFPLQTARACLLSIHVFRCTLYHGGDAYWAPGSPTCSFYQKLMYSFIGTSKLCLFADKRDVYQGPGGQESRRAHADRFLIGHVVALHLLAV